MSIGTIQESFANGPATTQSLFVGNNSKFVAGLASVESSAPGFAVGVEMRVLGTWLQISTNVIAPGLVVFPPALEGNIPAGTELRISITGGYTNASVFMMTS